MAFARSMRNICTKRVIIPTVLWFSYLALGAFVFSRIEGQKEDDLENEEKLWLQKLISQTIRNSTNPQVPQVNLQMKETDDLEILNQAIIADFIDQIVDRYHPEKRNYKWDMAGGAHFCLTVISTIGYGLLVPRTQLGRAVCVIYAVFGIPLNIIFMAGIGRLIARFVDRTYCLCLGAFRHCPCYRSQPKPDQNKECQSDTSLQLGHSVRNNQVSCEGAAAPDPGAAKDKQGCDRLKEAYGNVTRSSVFHSDWSKQPETSFTGPTLPKERAPCRVAGDAKSRDDCDEFDGPDVENPNDSGNPLAPVWFIIVFVIIASSIFIVSLWFSGILEDDWTFIDLIYFKFITFSTIGFGDLYINPPKIVSHHLSVFVDVVVLVVGMSLLSTVLNLITSSNRLDQALNFATCLLQTIWQYVSSIFRRKPT